MRASCDYHPWYPNVDPEFDEWGGALTLHQIADPLQEGDEEPAHYLARKQAQKEQARDRARYWARVAKQIEGKQAAYRQIRESRYRLTDLVDRFDRAARTLNSACCGCIPYNGHYTPHYWSPGQAAYRVERFLR